MALIFLAGCATAPPVPPPIVPDTAPPSVEETAALQRAFQVSLDQPYLVAKFSSRMVAGGGAPLISKGTLRWYRNDILLVEISTSGGKEVRVMRVGKRAWAFDPNLDWEPAEDLGLGHSGTGFQNPFELLQALNPSASRFRPVADEAGYKMFEWRGAEVLLTTTLQPMVHGMQIDTAASRMTGRIGIDGASIRTARLDGTFVSGGAAIRCEATVDLDPAGSPPPMKFNDVPVPFSKDMQTEIRKAMEAK